MYKMQAYKAVVIHTALLCIYFVNIARTTECVPRDYGNGGTVCVCNENYCDTVEEVAPVDPGRFIVYTSNKAGLRFRKDVGLFGEQIKYTGSKVTIDSTVSYQSIFGFGGAFTDAAAININLLNKHARHKLLESYFSSRGLEYSLCRVPIGGTDFSTHAYTYDDVAEDTSLSQFNLTVEDYNLKIPIIRDALSLTQNKLKLFATAWSAPAWMKTNNAISGFGFLRTEMYEAWADYHLHFLQSYKNAGIEFWGMTTGNEPSNGYLPFVKINSMGWTPSTQSSWISQYLGPKIRNSEYKNIKLIALDDQRFNLPWWIMLLFRNISTKNYIDGIGVHWYWDFIVPSKVIDTTHQHYPDKFILATEACVGDKPFQKKVDLGSWKRGEMYAEDIIEDLSHWMTGWVDWNIALDSNGGPTYIQNNVDSPIIVNATAQEFYKQPMFYALGHFAKFVPATSVKIQSEINSNLLKVIAFARPDNGTTVIIYNKHNKDIPVSINDPRRGFANIVITKRSINSLVYW